mmetsp:Transcript_6303/g.12806  ORF Transcript_6303/g.12806 Transcript_6303/m.12806 type:complete len:153 (+) Transcript_6303:141-599(+)|eukprot:CAMPEP_0118922616 /NCGR_PEP_ID=MMETSP1169-20130426/1489_1 /TAXON_ID=36882 /ORGANISM="Pyramimonas obovata, Strain CCMP722" /LENGTH=152 /DNA_ID=CAMNT_0006863525 /DNA_START=139 /DNA_END=597 /DNA_ORIENTATION=+
MRGFLFASLTLALVCVALGAGVPIDAGNFKSQVADSDSVWILEFYSPRCGTCAEMMPIYESVSQKLKSLANFGGVNIDEKDGMKLAQDLDVFSEGIPQIQAYRTVGGKPTTVWTGYDVPSKSELESLVRKALAGTPKDPSGMHKKLSGESEF